jgi:hypothetical protein
MKNIASDKRAIVNALIGRQERIGILAGATRLRTWALPPQSSTIDAAYSRCSNMSSVLGANRVKNAECTQFY